MKKILFALLLFIPTIIHAQTISTYAGGATGALGDGGPATAANMGSLHGLTFDKHGNLYISDILDNRVRRVDAVTGIITTVAGTGILSTPLGDGGPATAANIHTPLGMVCDTAGNLYIADRYNYRVRKVNVATGIITTVAGNGIHDNYGGTGDGGQATAATFNTPADLRIDKNGNLLIADNSAQRIRKVNAATGIISNFAGTWYSAGHSGDGGPATAAQISDPRFITLDDDDNIYIAEQLGRYLRKINAATGIITTVAGTGLWTFNGDTMPATNCNFVPTGLVYHNNALYFGTTDDRVRKLDLSNDTVYTIAGNGTETYSGDGGPAIAATLYNPQGVAKRGCTELFVADASNERVRKIDLPPTLLTPTITLTVPVGSYIGATVVVNATVTGAGSSYLIRWMKNSVVFATTTVPSASYIKIGFPWVDTITATVIPEGEFNCYDSTKSSAHLNMTGDGVEDVAGTSFSVYPNPANSILCVTGGGISSLSIYNILGRQVFAEQYRSSAEKVDVGHLPNGVYILKVNGQIAGKFLKE